MDRRAFLAAGMGGLATMVGLSRYDSSDPQRAFDEFPNSMPGADVKKYPVEDSKHCLVHVLMNHSGKVYSKEDIAVVDNCQRDIYGILDFLRENQGLTKLYQEGFTPENLAKYEQHPDVFERYVDTCLKTGVERAFMDVKRGLMPERGIGLMQRPRPMRTRMGVGNVSPLTTEQLDKIRETIDLVDYARENSDKHPYFPGAGLRMAVEGKIGLKATEDQLLMDLSESEHLLRRLGSNCYDVTCTAREDHVLKLLAEDKDPLNVVLFGGGHAWGGKHSCGEDYDCEERDDSVDNIFMWNTLHPEEKFSLIEIRPKNLVLRRLKASKPRKETKNTSYLLPRHLPPRHNRGPLSRRSELNASG